MCRLNIQVCTPTPDIYRKQEKVSGTVGEEDTADT